MLTKSQLSFIRSLHQKKFREEHRLFIAEGSKLVNDLLQSDFRVVTICSTEKGIHHFQTKVSKITDTIVVSEKEMERISALSTPSDALAVVAIPAEKKIRLGKELVLMLDEIKDPGNLGTIIRIADWFGIKKIICSPDTVEVYNPKVVQATMGSVARVNVHYYDLENFLNLHPELPVYGTVLSGKNIYHADLHSEGIVILGNESRGIGKKIVSYIQYPVSIPRFGQAESLNVAIAAGIICSEFKRR